MPIIKGAKKALRASKRKRVYNLRRKDVMNETVKKVRKLAVTQTQEATADALKLAYQAIDKAAKRGVIKKNTASRKKARLVAAIKRNKK